MSNSTGQEPDRTGYTVLGQHEDEDEVQTTWAVTREEDGTGLGAYATQNGVDTAIRQDRATAEQREANRTVVDPRSTGPLITEQPPVAEPDGTRVDV